MYQVNSLSLLSQSKYLPAGFTVKTPNNKLKFLKASLKVLSLITVSQKNKKAFSWENAFKK